MSDIYYHPEHYGFRTIAELDRSSGSYEFDLMVVWKRISDGGLFYAIDCGCSCPLPFEDVDAQDLTHVGEDFDVIVDAWWTGGYGADGSLSDKASFEAKVRDAR